MVSDGKARPDEETENDEDDLVTIKCAFNSILREPYADELKARFYNRSLEMTKIAFLASHLLLFEVNRAVDRNDSTFFENNDSKKIIMHIFNAVVNPNYEYYTMPTEFRQLIERGHPNFVWPRKTILGNAFDYYYQQYERNVKTNLNTWCENRLRYLLKIICYQWNMDSGHDEYDEIDVRNTLKYVLQDTNWTDGDDDRVRKLAHLLWLLEQYSFPTNLNIKEDVKENWFESLWSFALIQRRVEHFLSDPDIELRREQWTAYNEDKENNAKPLFKRPPKVNNFTVVPLSDYHLKHTRFDHTNCYNLTSSFKVLPRYRNEKTKRLNNRSKGSYENDKRALWNIFFDMDKIDKMGKNWKGFNFQFLTDGVSVSLLFKKKEKPAKYNFPNLLMIFLKYMCCYFVFEIGIDPGDKTWLAAVRRNIATKIEVNKYILFHLYVYDFEIFIKLHRKISKYQIIAIIGVRRSR